MYLELESFLLLLLRAERMAQVWSEISYAYVYCPPAVLMLFVSCFTPSLPHSCREEDRIQPQKGPSSGMGKQLVIRNLQLASCSSHLPTWGPAAACRGPWLHLSSSTQLTPGWSILEALAPSPGCEEQLADLRLVRHCFLRVDFLLFAVRGTGRSSTA